MVKEGWQKVFIFISFVVSVALGDYMLTIVHTNDVHSRFEMFTDRGASCKHSQTCYGGVSRRAGFIKEVRAKEDNVLLLDAGDQFQGTPWFSIYKGMAASHFLDKLHYTAMCLGNHEFDNGVAGLESFLNNVSTPILCSNLVIDPNVSDIIRQKVKKHLIKEIGGKKIGIIGYITEKVTSLSKTEHLKFERIQDALKREIQVLKMQGVDFIIALGHAGLQRDRTLMKWFSEIDVFVGGHSHSLMHNLDAVSNDVAAGQYPETHTHAGGRTSFMVQAGSEGKYVGKLTMIFNDAGIPQNIVGNTYMMNSTVPQDLYVLRDVGMMNNKVLEMYKDTLGQTAMDFDTKDNVCRVRECEMGNMYADAMIEYTEMKDEWMVDMALVNGGSFRNSFVKGNITYGDALTVFPFNNDMVIVTLQGEQVMKVFEHSVADFSLVSKNGKFLQISGVKVKYNTIMPNQQRVEWVKVKNKNNDLYEDVVLTLSYKVFIPSFLANGGDGYTIFETVQDQIFNIDILDIDVFITYLKKHSPIQASIEGRIQGMDTYKEIKSCSSMSTSHLFFSLTVFLFIKLFT